MIKCPFCGKNEIIHDHQENGFSILKCLNCDIIGTFFFFVNNELIIKIDK